MNILQFHKNLLQNLFFILNLENEGFFLSSSCIKLVNPTIISSPFLSFLSNMISTGSYTSNAKFIISLSLNKFRFNCEILASLIITSPSSSIKFPLMLLIFYFVSRNHLCNKINSLYHFLIILHSTCFTFFFFFSLVNSFIFCLSQASYWNNFNSILSCICN